MSMAKQRDRQTDFDDEVDEAPKAVASVGVTETGIPYCRKHMCQMEQSSGGDAGSPVAYCRCRVEGCKQTAKRVKNPKSVIPIEPHRCHRCPTKPIMERDERISTGLYSILKCPVCSHASAPIPLPELVKYHTEARSKQVVAVGDLGSR